MGSIYDSPEMTGAFLDEVEEQLQLLEQYILELEEGNEIPKVIPKVFRVAHTLKGSSALIEFEKMKVLTHEMENVLDKIRNHHLEVSKPVINTLFHCLDRLRQLKEDFLADRNSIKTDISSVLSELRMVLSNEGDNNKYPENIQDIANQNVVIEEKEKEPCVKFQLNFEQQMQIEKALIAGNNVFACEVNLVKDTVMKLARSYLILNAFNQVGTVIQVEPDILKIEELSTDTLYYLIITQMDDKAIETKVLNEIMEIDRIKVYPYHVDVQKQENMQSGSEMSEIQTQTSGKPGDTERKANHTVRVDVERLEKMMDLVGELVIERTRVAKVGNILHDRYAADNTIEELVGISNQISRVTNELQEIVLKTRMLPIQQLFGRFPRLVRDLAQTLNKDVKLVLEGEETELDKTIIEDIADPLIHLIRNAADHGIERPEERIRVGKNSTSILKISAFHEENHVIITVQDDGRGIDVIKVKECAIKKQIITPQEASSLTEYETINLIFRSGFSTSETVSEVSGRGVGMDVVKSHIDKLNGIIEVETKKGEGTKFIIKLPLTLAIITGLLVKISDETYVLPMSNVIEIVRKSNEEIEWVKGQAVTVIRDKVLSLVWLQDYFNIPREKGRENIFIVVLGVADKRFGLVVDDLIGNQEIVVKPLSPYIGKVETFSGATILDDGNVACILDVAGIAKMVGSLKISRI